LNTPLFRGKETTKKLADLQKLMDEILPGSGSMSKKLDTVESQ